MILSDHDEQVLAVLSLAADRRRLGRVARRVLERDDAVTELLRAAAMPGDGRAWRQISDVCDRRRDNAFNAVDLVVELRQQALVRAGEPRTWIWPDQRRVGRDARV